MNALEKLGYVKQPQDEDDGMDEYAMSDGDFYESITIDWAGKSVCKTFIFPTLDGQHTSYIDIDELKAILELMEETE